MCLEAPCRYDYEGLMRDFKHYSTKLIQLYGWFMENIYIVRNNLSRLGDLPIIEKCNEYGILLTSTSKLR